MTSRFMWSVAAEQDRQTLLELAVDEEEEEEKTQGTPHRRQAEVAEVAIFTCCRCCALQASLPPPNISYCLLLRAVLAACWGIVTTAFSLSLSSSW